jgi:ADP-heptose:LPS heptosyltransferase
LAQRLYLLWRGVRLHWDRYPQDGTILRPFSGVVEVRGWAVAPSGVRSVEVYCDDRLLGRAAIGLRRRDLFRLFPHIRSSRRSGYQYLFDTTLSANGHHHLTLVARSRSGRSTRLTTVIYVKNLATSYDRYRRQTAPSAAALAWMRRNQHHLPYQPLISLGVGIASAREIDNLAITIQSATGQAYDNWELLITAGPELPDKARARVQEWAASDRRITLLEASTSPLWKTVIQSLSGDWFGWLDAGDALTPDALFEMVYHLNRHPGLEFVYSDEEWAGRIDAPAVPCLKTDWTPGNRPASEIIGRLWLARTSLLFECVAAGWPGLESSEAAGARPELPKTPAPATRQALSDPANESEFLVHLSEQTQRIGHVAKILCCRRQPPSRRSPTAAGISQCHSAEPIVLTHAPCPLLDLEQVRSILIVKLDHLGDVLLSIPAMRRLREIFPEARITALVGSWSRPLIEAEPAIDEVLTYDYFAASSSHGCRRLSAEDGREVYALFAGRRFDLAIDLRRESDTREFLRVSRAMYTVGYANRGEHEWLTVAIPWQDVIPVQPPRHHVALDALRLVEMIVLAARAEVVTDYRLPCPDDGEAERILAERLPSDTGLLAGLHPGAGRAIKCWPVERFAELADRLVEQLHATVVVFGTKQDEVEVEGVLRHVRRRERIVSMAYQLSLPQFMAILKRLDFFVGNDSGPTHMAGAACIPTLGVYAATIDASQWAPLGPQAAVIQKRMLCSPCYLAKKQYCPYGIACLSELSVADVWEAALRMLLPNWDN